MRKIYSGKSQLVGGGQTVTLHRGPGKIYTLIATNEATGAGAVTLYDHTGVDAAAVLFKLALTLGSPVVIQLPHSTPIVFETALTVVTSASTRVFVITEAEV